CERVAHHRLCRTAPHAPADDDAGRRRVRCLAHAEFDASAERVTGPWRAARETGDFAKPGHECLTGNRQPKFEMERHIRLRTLRQRWRQVDGTADKRAVETEPTARGAAFV